MGDNVLNGKRILAVDDEPDILEILAEELEKYNVKLDKALSYDEGIQRLVSYSYDIVILDIMGVRGFDLLMFAVSRDLPVVMLTAHALSPEALKKSIELGARAYLPKDVIDQIGPFLEDVLSLSYESAWTAVFHRLGEFFGKRFGSDWRKSEHEFWNKFQKDLELKEATIIKE